MKKIVLKFGGTSLMDTNRIQQAAEIVEHVAAEGYDIVVVVSAMGHTTDHLLGLAKTFEDMPDSRELDALLSTGELISASLMTVALQARGFSAKSFSGAAAGIVTDSKFGNAGIERIDTTKLQYHLDKGTIPVVAGFQGMDQNGDVTTLGRGGSDATAIALAGALKAERCDIYTDVEGIYSVDPRLFTQAYKLDAISFNDMLAMAKCGAKVLQAGSVQIAMKHHVPVRVRSTFAPNDEGTLVTEEAKQVNSFTGIAVDKTKCCLKIVLNHLETSDKTAQRVFRHNRHALKTRVQRVLFDAGIDFEFGRSMHDSAYEVALCISQDDAVQAQKLIKDTLNATSCTSGCSRTHGSDDAHAHSTSSNRHPECKTIIVENDLAKLSVIGAQLTSSYEVAVMQTLTKAGIPISLIATHENQLSVMIPIEMIEDAVALTHENYCPLKIAC
jgi:aspartate kinase